MTLAYFLIWLGFTGMVFTVIIAAVQMAARGK
jgi:hypothetical protein